MAVISKIGNVPQYLMVKYKHCPNRNISMNTSNYTI